MDVDMWVIYLQRFFFLKRVLLRTVVFTSTSFSIACSCSLARFLVLLLPLLLALFFTTTDSSFVFTLVISSSSSLTLSSFVISVPSCGKTPVVSTLIFFSSFLTTLNRSPKERKSAVNST
ncbi:hypothetical protein BDB00DRAFT_408917 [Zychaea mexicana]|uniref:uncharacterized protein n=1 Tax=Zychaea mexicana TaxID=64656 RepID=UPI0022FDB1F3|nr:uncharacterized protein BDB00DRAFT_408917 [Zychaea mexicana]KAI9492945.1 hypothetical protein BDB00DRAFT_408917 [Zychaea mexicana]